MRIVLSKADDGRVIHVSQASSVPGLGPDTVGKTSVEAGFWPDEATRQEHVRTLREDGSRYRRVDYTDADGAPRTQYRFARIIKSGDTEYVGGVAIELAELRHREQELRETAERLERAQLLAGIGDYRFSPDSGTFLGSAGFLANLGLTGEQAGLKDDLGVVARRYARRAGSQPAGKRYRIRARSTPREWR